MARFRLYAVVLLAGLLLASCVAPPIPTVTSTRIEPKPRWTSRVRSSISSDCSSGSVTKCHGLSPCHRHNGARNS